MRRTFCFQEKTFVGESFVPRMDMVGSYSLWNVVELDGKPSTGLLFLTTAQPAPDQLVVFYRCNQSFVFFEVFTEMISPYFGHRVWNVGKPECMSHFTHSLPYCPRAYVAPYIIQVGDQQEVVFQFRDCREKDGVWSIQKEFQGAWYPIVL